MKFLKGFFITLGVLTFISLALSITGIVIAMNKGAPDLPDQLLVRMDIDAPLSESRAMSFTKGRFLPSLHDYVFTIHEMARDERVKGLFVRLGQKDFTPTQIKELGRALDTFRASGKPMRLYSEDLQSFSNGLTPLAFASYFDTVWLQPLGSAYPGPFSAEVPFFKDLLAKIGIQPEFEKQGAYKTAPETFTQSEPSAENREMLKRLATGINNNLEKIILERRALQNWDALQEQVILSDRTLLEAGLVHQLGYYDQFKAAMEQEALDSGAKIVEFHDYQANVNALARDDVNTDQAKKVAYLLMEGLILAPSASEAQSNKKTALGGDAVIDPRLYEEALLDIAKSDDIDAVIIRIDSPGGTPTGAEMITRAIEAVRQSGKKVYISMGSMAASGGYWVAMPGDEILANPATLTGSIGVYGGKFNLTELWDKIGVNWLLENGPDSESYLFSPNHAMTEQDRAALKASMEHIYEAFLVRVARYRNIPIETLREEIAGGRVWLGEEALDNGLIDQIGGLYETFNLAKADLGLKETDKVAVVQYPAPKTPIEEFLSILDEFMNTRANIKNKMSASDFWYSHLKQGQVLSIEPTGPML